MTKKQILKIFQTYIKNDVEKSDIYTVRDAILAVADEYEIRELGFGWVLDGEE